MLGENCEALGNVLIIQEVNDCPYDIADSVVLTFDFANKPGVYVKELGLLEVPISSKVSNLDVFHWGRLSLAPALRVYPKLKMN